MKSGDNKDRDRRSEPWVRSLSHKVLRMIESQQRFEIVMRDRVHRWQPVFGCKPVVPEF